MTRTISRNFVTLDGRWGPRQVHYRRAGTGPLLLMLHQSPQSSRELEPLMTAWAAHFTIVAPDSPGYGLSDPLGVDMAELGDFATATIEFMDAIGAARFGIYGFHTGGMIGIAVAHHYPDRVSGFACNGIVVPTIAELNKILAAYLPRFEPRWDAGHLAWLWGRMREQTIFFPWHERSLAARMDFPMPSPQHQQNSVLEFLRAGDHYHVAYRAAFVFPGERVVAELTAPGLITAADWDPLQPHLDRLRNTPPCVQILESATPEEASTRCLDHLRAHPGGGPPAVAATRPLAGRLWREMAQTASGAVAMRRGGNDQGIPVVVVHGAGGSSATVVQIVAGIAERRAVVAIDLPGHGETDHTAEIVDTRACVESLSAVLDALNLQAADLVGVDDGSFIAVELANQRAECVRRVALMNPPVMNAGQAAEWRAAGLPSFAPDWAGGHLLRCWHMVRDSRLFFPWFRRDRDGIRWQEPELDDRGIQREVTEYLKSDGAWQSLLDGHLDYPLLERLGPCREKVIVCASPSNPWLGPARATAARAGVPFELLPEEPGRCGPRLAAILSA